MKNKKQKNKKRGFTLMEVMVASTVFALVMTVGVGALVTVVNSYNAAKENKIASDSLNFMVESMVREIRLGRDYHVDILAGGTPGESSDGRADNIGFTAVEDRGYYIYDLDGGTFIRRRILSGGTTYTERLNDPNQLSITQAEFVVSGTRPFSLPDENQPYVWLNLSAEIPGSDPVQEFTVQTMVSQRKIDFGT